MQSGTSELPAMFGAPITRNQAGHGVEPQFGSMKGDSEGTGDPLLHHLVEQQAFVFQSGLNEAVTRVGIGNLLTCREIQLPEAVKKVQDRLRLRCGVNGKPQEREDRKSVV